MVIRIFNKIIYKYTIGNEQRSFKVEVKSAKIFNANQVALLLNISKQTLLRYEQRGIFPKAQRNTVNNWREYTEEDVVKLRHIMGR